MTGSAKIILDLLSDPGAAPSALFVGGCVRDTLLNLPVADIDIATRHRPEIVMDRLTAAGIHVVPTGLKHGTVTAVRDGCGYEITTLRHDVETDGRHARVAFTDDWRADAERRDFTINTLLADAQGHVFDPLGQGIADLRAGRVRFVGDPATRIAEDHLRILRFFRFHGRYGQSVPDADGFKACQDAAGMIDRLSRERITQELLNILKAPNSPQTCEAMARCGVLPALLAGFDVDMSTDLVRLQTMAQAVDILARLVALNGSADFPAVLESQLVLSRHDSDYCRTVSVLAADGKFDTLLAVRRAVYHAGNRAALGALLIAAARKRVDPDPAFVTAARDWTAPALPVRGADVLALGYSGRAVGERLSHVEQWWMDRDFAPDRAACLDYLRQA